LKKLLAVAVAASLVAAVPSFAQNSNPYKIPPGQYCKNVPKTKLPGQKKTQFAQCVTAMAQLNKNADLAPSQACASLKKGVKGKANKKKAQSAFKACVKAGNKLKLDNANAGS
jgi:hypothetical protein